MCVHIVNLLCRCFVKSVNIDARDKVVVILFVEAIIIDFYISLAKEFIWFNFFLQCF